MRSTATAIQRRYARRSVRVVANIRAHMETGLALFGFSGLLMVVVQAMIAYSAMLISGNHAGLCLIVPFYAPGFALRYKWYGLAGAWFAGALGAIIGLSLHK